jgi:hypothetical protein
MLSQTKSAGRQVISTTLAAHQGNYDPNSAFEKDDRSLKQKRTGGQFHNIAPLTL